MQQPYPSLSEFGSRSRQPSTVNEMTESFAIDFREGTDINLGVGYVNDVTIPGGMIQQALAVVLDDPVRYRNALNYGGADGSPSLRSAIKHYYLKNGIGKLTESDFRDIIISIGANGATSILDSFAEVIEPGIVITADPFYYIYCDTLRRKGFEVVTVPEDEHGIRIDLLEETLVSIDRLKLRFFYIVTVNNPSSTILANERKQVIVAIAETMSQREERLIPVLFDKAYEDIIHDRKVVKPVSGLKHDKHGLIFEIGTFSKAVAPALRIGYMLTRNREVSELITQKISDIGFSAPLMNQEITAWILDHYIQEQLRKVNDGYRIKAEQTKRLLADELGEHLLDLKGGSGGFYFYLTLSVETHKDSAFFRYLNRTTGDSETDGHPEKNPRLVYIPGTCCVNPDGAMKDIALKQLRISYGFESMEQIKKAVILIKEAIEYSKSTATTKAI